MYTMPDDASMREGGGIPHLVISNCSFLYFFGGYESLIHYETDNLWVALKKEPRYEDNVRRAELVYYLASNGEETGMRLNISNSHFNHSRFCRGLIHHQPTLANYT
jgi:hypothetical protein